jgi:Sec-independent protein translocase protein TatA
MRNLGRGVVEFKKGTQDIEDDSDDSATKKPKDSV